MVHRDRPTNIGLLYDWFAEAARPTVMHLDRPFDIAPDAGTRFDGAGLADVVREASGWLYAAGLRHGDRLAIVKDNHYDMLMLAAAAARIGALPAVIAPLKSVETVRTMVARVGPALVVASPGMLARAAAAGSELAAPGVRTVVLGEPGNGAGPQAVTLANLRGAEPPPPNPRRADEPMIVVHSSGTTGVPKLVVHSADTIGWAMSRMETIRWPVVESSTEDVVAISVAFAHGRIVSWTAGQFVLAPKSLVIISDHGLDNVASMLAEHRPTSLEACPNIFQRWEELAETRPELFRDVRLFVGTFDAIHPRTVRKFLATSRRRIPVWGQAWGQSEVGPICIAAFTRRQVRRRPEPRGATNDIGWPVPILSRVKVVDPETGRKQPRGKPGILMVATKSRCLGYLGEEDRHAEKVRGKWWNTGDIGQRGRFGRLKLIDREVDLLPGASGVELESILLDRLERATEVVVLGVPGRPPVPVLCMRDDRLDPAEWAAATADLPALDEPIVIPWEDVPRTATWKIRRLELRELVLGTKDKIGTGRWT
jgi:acyl-coenzyme A synthetase/AMP-(fatty) acid ligase